MTVKVAGARPGAVNVSVYSPTAPVIERPVNVATPALPVTAVGVPASEPSGPAVIDTVTVTPACDTSLSEASFSWMTGAVLKPAPLTSVRVAGMTVSLLATNVTDTVCVTSVPPSTGTPLMVAVKVRVPTVAAFTVAVYLPPPMCVAVIESAPDAPPLASVTAPPEAFEMTTVAVSVVSFPNASLACTVMVTVVSSSAITVDGAEIVERAASAGPGTIANVSAPASSSV